MKKVALCIALVLVFVMLLPYAVGSEIDTTKSENRMRRVEYRQGMSILDNPIEWYSDWEFYSYEDYDVSGSREGIIYGDPFIRREDHPIAFYRQFRYIDYDLWKTTVIIQWLFTTLSNLYSP